LGPSELAWNIAPNIAYQRCTQALVVVTVAVSTFVSVFALAVGYCSVAMAANLQMARKHGNKPLAAGSPSHSRRLTRLLTGETWTM
jgi:hypothetical protein